MNKKIGAMILAMTMVLSLSMTTLASAAVPVVDKSQMTVDAISAISRVYLNKVPISGDSDMGYFWIDANGRTQAPVRLLVESMGYSISYNKGVVTIPGGPNGDIKITIGSEKLLVGDSEVKMDTIGATIDGRTYVPLRFVAEALGATVEVANSAKGLNIYLNYTMSPNRTINGVASIPLQNCENLQAVVKKYEGKTSSEIGLVRFSYVAPNGVGLKLEIQEADNSYTVSGLSFDEKAKPQYEMIFALIDDVVEESSRAKIKEMLQYYSDICAKDYNPETGSTQEAVDWKEQNAGKTTRIGNVNFTWSNRYCTGFTIAKASN